MWNDIATAVDDWLPTIAFFLPIVVGLIIKAGANKQVKTTVQLLATLIVTLVASSRTGGGLTGDMLREWAQTSTITIAAYYGVWSNIEVGTPESSPFNKTSLANLIPTKGLGPMAPTADVGD